LLRRPPTEAVPWRVVSMVREPIAQTVSAFFQPAQRRGYLDAGATVTSLLERFGDRLDRLPLRWFETHVEPALGIDVYAEPFDVRARFQILSTSTVRLLLLRCEDLRVAPTALAELLDVDEPVPIPRVNVGADKGYAETYAAFLAALRPSAAQLDRAYGSRLVRHFYSPDEIARFRTVWSAEPGARPGTDRGRGRGAR
ncbi:MAG TPA: putative capsular polysaccharide synthesis family protein, partial [Acidimicrobiia bacterium]|nr:putative capsular polysaccharide synthesis family protein [Acidimicrobiia bacterium]